MPYANLNVQNEIDGFNSIIIVKDLGDVPAGVTLDVTGITDTTIKAGRVLVQNTTDFSVKPLGISTGAYDNLPAGYAYFGILKDDTLTARPMAAVLRKGQVNAAAAKKYVGAPYSDAIIAALQKNGIDFLYTAEAATL